MNILISDERNNAKQRDNLIIERGTEFDRRAEAGPVGDKCMIILVRSQNDITKESILIYGARRTDKSHCHIRPLGH